MGAKMGAKVGTKLESVIGFCIQCFRMINMLHNEHVSWVFVE